VLRVVPIDPVLRQEHCFRQELTRLQLHLRKRKKKNEKNSGNLNLSHSYSGGRDQEDHGFEASPKQTAHENLSRKIPNTKRNRDGRMVQGVGLEFKPQYCKNKQTKKHLNQCLK
jgi:hypothetical protein